MTRFAFYPCHELTFQLDATIAYLHHLGSQITQRNKQQAIETLKQYRQQITDKKTTFAELASKESDCSSARAGGDLGEFGRGQMQKPFEDATYGLKVGQLSDVVDTESGVHIILRTG